jgi:3-hydroxymyristoyl/3-hydroxydecanoyl-(acyl carrier protein) dehydratase
VNIIQKEILDSVIDINTESNSELKIQISFTDKFIGFDGHFDERPVLPAICLLEVFKCSLFKHLNKMPIISEVLSAKFYNVIGVKEKIDISITSKQDFLDPKSIDKELIFNVKFIGAGAKKAILKIKTKSINYVK